MEAGEARIAITEAEGIIAVVLKELEGATGLNVGSIKLDDSREAFESDIEVEIQMYLMGA